LIQQSQATSGDKGKDTCVHCGKPAGHWARDCPSKKLQVALPPSHLAVTAKVRIAPQVHLVAQGPVVIARLALLGRRPLPSQASPPLRRPKGGLGVGVPSVLDGPPLMALINTLAHSEDQVVTLLEATLKPILCCVLSCRSRIRCEKL
jgi:hypothetical protein